MKQITVFKTQDSKLFESKEQAEAHEIGQLLTEQLDDFSKQGYCPYPEGVANSQMRKSIIAWERAKKLPVACNLEDLQLTVRTFHILRAANILTLDQLLTWSPQQLLAIETIGRKSLNEIVQALRLKNHQLTAQ